MNRFRLTKASKALIFFVIILLMAGGVFTLFKTGIVGGNKPNNPKVSNTASELSTPKESKSESTEPDDRNKSDSTKNKTINISLDEWIGWKPIIDANMGLTTQPDSIFGKLGLDVKINIINDATQSSTALVKGDLNAAGYTTNRIAFLSQKFKESSLDVVMPVFTNYSNGGDGIIALSKYNSVESLVDAKIGVPRFSEAQTLVIWFVNKSDLTQEQKDKIITNLVMFDTPDDAAKAFFAGKVDAAATWQPYLSQALSSTDSHILFDTKASNKLIMDGVVFRKDFATENPEVVSKFIDGIFQAENMYTTEFKFIREVMPMFSTETDENIIASAGDAGLANWKSNMNILQIDAPSVYYDMCDIWESVGETVNKDLGKTLFDISYMESLSEEYSAKIETVIKPKITQEMKDSVKDVQALMTKTSSINFVADTAKFIDNVEAALILDEFIKIANALDGTIIQIEGNINASSSTEAGQKLSEERAKTVANYFIANGVDPNRIVIVGNGNSKMIGDVNTEEGKVLNRRTDVFFKTIES